MLRALQSCNRIGVSIIIIILITYLAISHIIDDVKLLSRNRPDKFELYGDLDSDEKEDRNELHVNLVGYPNGQQIPESKDSLLPRIAILTPIYNVDHILGQFGDLLMTLTYPHNQISVVLGEDSSTDNTVRIAQSVVAHLRESFRSANLVRLNITRSFPTYITHELKFQYVRRQHLARVRNLMLRNVTQEVEWVLWVDSDVEKFPVDIIQQLLSANKDIVAPVCVYRKKGQDLVYDKNTWRETNDSLRYQKQLSPDKLMIEGYQPTKRLFLPDLESEGDIVPLDGVGGCVLLVRAECFRKDLVFPEDVYEHHLETEGLGKMAANMGFGVYGMPFVKVLHR